MKVRFGVGAALALLLITAASSWAEVKIAVVDVQKVIMTSKTGRTADAKIKDEFGPIQEKITKMEEDLQKMQEEVKKSDSSTFLSDEAKQKKREEFQKAFQEYQEKGAKWEAELRKRQRELTDTILSKIKLIAADIAKKQGYTIILEKSDDSPFILWASEQIDVTLDVINALDK